MNRNITPAILAALVVVLVVAVLVVTAATRLSTPSQTQQFDFPEKLDIRLVLPEFSVGISSRVASYAEDGTLQREDVFFQDGSVGYINYRDDGKTISSYGAFYPEVAGQPKQVKEQVQFEADGVSLAWEKRFREDGTEIRTGHRLATGEYKVETFFADGTSTAGDFIFQEEGKLVSSHEFHENGKDKKVVEVVPHKGTNTTDFSPAGLKTAFHWVHGGNEVWETYQADGVTPIVRYEQKAEGTMGGTSYYTYGTYYNEDGSINHVRKFSRNYMTAYFLDDEENVLYRQEFKHKTPDAEDINLSADQWLFESIHLGDDGDYSAPVFYLHDDGSVERHVYPETEDTPLSMQTIRVFHPDGSLAEFERPDPDNPGTKLEDTYEPGENSERFDMSLLEGRHILVPYTVPPRAPPKPKSLMGR